MIPVSPITAFTISVVTIYNNALVFSLYSYFLPKDKVGKFLMPAPITEAGSQILIGGGCHGPYHRPGDADAQFGARVQE